MSTADMVPSYLQDSGRVVIFGYRTNGAGGNVVDIPTIGYSDFSTKQTESLAYRPKAIMSPNGIMTHYIENVGVIPDIEYNITEDDFLYGYEGYKIAIENTIKTMLEVK